MSCIRRVLAVDDDPFMESFVLEALSGRPYEIDTARDGESALRRLDEEGYDLVLTDMKMPGLSGMELLRHVRQISPDTVVIMMTAYASVDHAVKAMREGAFDYLTKPFSPDELCLLIDRAEQHIALLDENRYLRSALADRRGKERLVGRDPAMLRIYSAISRIAPSRATVLIQGESGTGKELVARAIHDQSPRRDGAFVSVNCAALPEPLLESELFGHEKGSFTGAHATKRGRFELADAGTLLLDEISEIAPSMQAKLLRVLQQREFERVGGTRPITVDVRVIATTNRDLREAIDHGTFREDLFYRLNVVSFTVPPLRERLGDVPLLARHFLRRFAADNESSMKAISPKALETMCAHDWPGNVRELENVIEQAVVMHTAEQLLPEHLPINRTAVTSSPTVRIPLGSTVREAERELILRTLDEMGGNRTRTASVLGISVRCLRNKLNQYRETAGIAV